MAEKSVKSAPGFLKHLAFRSAISNLHSINLDFLLHPPPHLVSVTKNDGTGDTGRKRVFLG